MEWCCGFQFRHVINKIVFTSPEATVINPSARYKPFLTPQTHLGTYVNLYSFKRLMK